MSDQKILIVDDEENHRVMLRVNLEDEGYEIREAENGEMAVDLVSHERFDCVLMDIRMPVMDGSQALEKIKKISPELPVIMMTAYASVKSAVESLKCGAEDYIMKPLNIDEVVLKVKKVLEVSSIREENVLFRERLGVRYDFSKMIGKSPLMQELFESLSLVAPSEATVLILGESGVGKELVANAIHQNSKRANKPFIKVNCAAIPATLLESELFGHEIGAFTGAVSRRDGRFMAANEGTIFLDEIAELDMSTQAKILRVLQEKEFEPVGSDVTLNVDVRILAATNRDLEHEMEKGHFREDLYYRLNVVPLFVPPLRSRKDDLMELSNYFLRTYCGKEQKDIREFEPEVMDMFIRYRWPGNVRELENVIERAVILTKGESISPTVLPDKIRTFPSETKEVFHFAPGITLKDTERHLIEETLRATGGNRTKAADLLGITRRTLQNKIKEYDLDL